MDSITRSLFSKTTAEGCVIEKREFHNLADKLRKVSEVVVDVEGTSKAMYGVGLAFDCGNGIESYYIPYTANFRSPDIKQSYIKSFLSNELSGKKLIGHNIKYDYHVMADNGIILPDDLEDTMIMAWILDSTQKKGLDDLLAKYNLGGKKKKWTDVDVNDIEDISSYCRTDCEKTYELYRILKDEIAESEYLAGIYMVEKELLPYVIQMERKGVLIDLETIDALDEELEREREVLEDRLFTLTGKRINMESPQQVRAILPDDIIKVLPDGKTGVSTSSKSLQQYASDPVVQTILEYRSLSTIHSTFVRKIKEIGVDAGNGRVRIFGEFKQHGTDSGRFSSANPNLQNIPAGGETGKRIRSAFIADDGNVLIVADYSQLELRILAAVSKDKTLMEVYNTGGDLHDVTAKRLGVERKIAKMINFSIVYGASKYTIAERTGLSVSEAEKLLEMFYKAYPGITEAKERCLNELIYFGYVRTLFGRRRYYHDVDFSILKMSRQERAIKGISDEAYSKASGLFRSAFNTKIQGTGADIVKIGMVEARRLGVPAPILQVHDEIVVEVPEEDAETYSRLIRQALVENRTIKKVPVRFEVDIHIVKNWGDAK